MFYVVIELFIIGIGNDNNFYEALTYPHIFSLHKDLFLLKKNMNKWIITHFIKVNISKVR